MKLFDIKPVVSFLIILFGLNLYAQTIEDQITLDGAIVDYNDDLNSPYSLNTQAKSDTSEHQQLLVDPTTRSSVVAYYKNEYLPNLSVPIGWTGNANTCQAGTTSQAYLNATFAMINYFRSMVNLDPVTHDPALTAASQQAALMMSVNSSLSHSPPNTWDCYTTAGHQAASKSNLALGASGPNAIRLYIEDRGNFNAPVGHRRWILYPRAAQFGSGSVGGSTPHANALWVIGTQSTNRPATDIIAWPPEGYVPNTVVYNRWSFSLNNAPLANYSSANVTMSENGTPIALTVVSRTDNGYGDNTLVWEPVGLSFPSGQADRTINVTVSNIANAGQTAYSYQVIVINPEYLSDVIFEHGFEF